jgi:hypothetical protein
MENIAEQSRTLEPERQIRIVKAEQADIAPNTEVEGAAPQEAPAVEQKEEPIEEPIPVAADLMRAGYRYFGRS